MRARHHSVLAHTTNVSPFLLCDTTKMSNVDWGIAPTPAELASAQTLGAMELTRLLVRLLHLPRRAWADEDAMGLRSVLEHAYAHEDEWVRLLATVLDRYHATGVVLADTDGLLHVARQVATVVARPQTESQGGSFVQPLRCKYITARYG